MKYDNPELYINRELSWLDFNFRVLEEAQDKTNPLLERLKFLSITASNLDEFFMIRVAGLKEQVVAGYTGMDTSGLQPETQLKEISQKVHTMVLKQYSCLNRSIIPELKRAGIEFLHYGELDHEQKKYIDHYFENTVFPVLTPMAIDQSRPFPVLPNKSLNLALVFKKGKDKFFAIAQVPSVLPRIVKLPSGEGMNFMFLEELIENYIEDLFTGYKLVSSCPFKITRNADLSIDEDDAKDLLVEIERSLKERIRGFPVRLEIEKGMNLSMKDFLCTTLDLSTEDIYEIKGPIDLSVWMELFDFDGLDHLKFKSYSPEYSRAFFEKDDIFEAIREGDILLHHPYESFDHVEHFLNQAANDPSVLAIKQTLYRVSGDSPVVSSLIQAAENGKQVTVLVELKARFDEESNIQWAKKLEDAGCYVIYGLVGLKTHCKILLVVRDESDGIRRYIHMSTGNYNDKTARLYTDIGFFTCKELFGVDASALFNSLTGFSQPPQWNKLSIAPTNLRHSFLQFINKEVENVKNKTGGRIIAKINSLVDKEIIQNLYMASKAGVKIDLIVRGICCLRAGLKGISENITVRSIVGKYLEHSRIFYFLNGGKPKIFLSSADWMPRNLDGRIETLFPIEDENLKNRVIEILEILMKDTVKARIQKSDGKYVLIDKRGKPAINAQKVFCDLAKRSLNNQKRKKGREFKPIIGNKSE